MDRCFALLRIKSNGRVVLYTALITLFAVAVPVITLYLQIPPRASPRSVYKIMTIAAAIPLFITAPIAFLIFSIVRMLTVTIDRVDEYVRFDTLTGVLSRAYLLGQIREALPGGGVFLMADADHFKAINDTYGHDVGDEALKRIAAVLRTALGPDALIGRLGGEEFGVFLPRADEVAAAAAASALCTAMRAAGGVVAGHEVRLTISVGGAAHRKSQPLELTMKLADQALYHAKRSGRDRYYIAGAPDTMPALILGHAFAPDVPSPAEEPVRAAS